MLWLLVHVASLSKSSGATPSPSPSPPSRSTHITPRSRPVSGVLERVNSSFKNHQVLHQLFESLRRQSFLQSCRSNVLSRFVYITLTQTVTATLVLRPWTLIFGGPGDLTGFIYHVRKMHSPEPLLGKILAGPRFKSSSQSTQRRACRERVSFKPRSLLFCDAHIVYLRVFLS
jgi:hypothetical protein